MNYIKYCLTVPLKAIHIIIALILNTYSLSLVNMPLLVDESAYDGGPSLQVFLFHKCLHGHVTVAPEGHQLRQQGLLAEKDFSLILLYNRSRLQSDDIRRIEEPFLDSSMFKSVCNMLLNEMLYLVWCDLSLLNLNAVSRVPHQPDFVPKTYQYCRWY
jgi:hypothetical protein